MNAGPDPQTITWEGKPLLDCERDVLIQIVCQLTQDLEYERLVWNRRCVEMEAILTRATKAF